MADELVGKTTPFLAANEGVEQVQMTQPWREVERAGGYLVLAAPTNEPVWALVEADEGALAAH
jgi:deglycase